MKCVHRLALNRSGFRELVAMIGRQPARTAAALHGCLEGPGCCLHLTRA